MASSVDAALVGRLAATSGGTDYQAYYDDVLDITWRADAGGPNDNAYTKTWEIANTWATNLEVGGVSDWRLPGLVHGTPDDTSTNEMAHMFYETLGNLNFFDNPLTGGLVNTGPFSNLEATPYWSGTEQLDDPTRAWFFNFNWGNTSTDDKALNRLAWAVHDGDVAAVVPVPAAVWLFGSGLLGLIGVARRKKV